jgi:hypothetical protein
VHCQEETKDRDSSEYVSTGYAYRGRVIMMEILLYSALDLLFWVKVYGLV